MSLQRQHIELKTEWSKFIKLFLQTAAVVHWGEGTGVRGRGTLFLQTAKGVHRWRAMCVCVCVCVCACVRACVRWGVVGGGGWLQPCGWSQADPTDCGSGTCGCVGRGVRVVVVVGGGGVVCRHQEACMWLNGGGGGVG